MNYHESVMHGKDPSKYKQPFFKVTVREISDRVQYTPGQIKDCYTQLKLLKPAAKELPKQNPNEFVYGGGVLDQVRTAVVNGMRNLRAKVKREVSVRKYIRLEYNRKGIKTAVEGYKGDIKGLKQELMMRIHQERERKRAMRTHEGPYVNALRDHVYLTGKVHTEPGTWAKAQEMAKHKKIWLPKKPTNDAKHVGIEIEFVCRNDAESLAQLFGKAGLSDYVHLKEDGSINCDEDDGEYPHELTVLTKQTEVHDVVNRVCTVLAQVEAYANKSCGLHVHLDMRNRDIEMAWTNLRRSQSVLYKMVPVRRMKNDYSNRVRTTSFSKAARSNNRYVGINTVSLRNHKTIEIRLHSGTVDAKKINNWVALLVRIIDGKRLEKSVNVVSTLAKQVQLPTDLVAYMKERVKLFEKEHKTGQPEIDPETRQEIINAA